MSAAFVVILLIVAHRFLRLDLTQDEVTALHPAAVLTGLLALALVVSMLRRKLRLRLCLPIFLQWLLWLWALVCQVVSDGPAVVGAFLKGDYTKDVVFASLVSTLVDSVRKLKLLAWVFVLAMTWIAYITLPQHDGQRKCYHFPPTGELNYVEATDNRHCDATSDCFNMPKGEESLQNEGWACEREGKWGLGTVLDRIHYVGTLADPNALSLALVMAAAMALGLAFWPVSAASLALHGPRRGRRLLLQALLGGAVLLMSLAVFYAASRAAQAALALVFLSFFYSRIGLLGAALAAALGAPLVLMSNRNAQEAAYSTFTRIQTQLNGYQAFLEQPLFGVGFGNYMRISFITAHNSFLLTATETGIIGSALFVLGVYMAFKFLVQVLRMPDPTPEEVAEDAALQAQAQRGRAWFADAEEPEHAQTLAERLEELYELRHCALMLLSMLVGVGWCVSFLSLSFDVMWLFPVGVISAFYCIVQDRMPGYEFKLRLWELGAVLAVGGLLPALFAVMATHGLM